MSKITKRNAFGPCAILVGIMLLAASGRAQEENGESAHRSTEQKTTSTIEPDADKVHPELPTLESMLLSAMQSNPDILVAEAAVREAEAKLNRTRLHVVRQVVTLRAAVKSQHEKVEAIRKLVQTKRVSTAEFRDTMSELSAREAELQYLLGEQPASLESQGEKAEGPDVR